MAWAHVQDSPGSNSAAIGLNVSSKAAGAFGSPVTIGNYIVVGTWGDNASATIAGNITCSDNGSTPNTYTQLNFKTATFGTGKGWVAVFVAPVTSNPGSGNLNVTVSSSQASSNIMVCAAEFSGGSTTTDGSSNNTNTNNTAVPSCGTMTTTDSTDILLAVMSDVIGSTPTWTDPTSYTSVGKLTAGASSDVGQLLYRIPGSTVTNNNPTWASFSDSSASNGWVTVQVALKAAAAGGGATTDLAVGPAQIPNRNVGPAALRLGRHSPTPFDVSVLAPVTADSFGARVLLPNNRVGPMALRQLWHEPVPFDMTLAPPTVDDFAPLTRIPNNRVGPMALRALYRPLAYPFDSSAAVASSANRLRRLICSGA